MSLCSDLIHHTVVPVTSCSDLVLQTTVCIISCSNSLSFGEGWGEACSVFIHRTAVSIATTFIKAQQFYANIPFIYNNAICFTLC